MQFIKNIFSNRPIVLIAIIAAALTSCGGSGPSPSPNATPTLAAVKPTQQVVSAEGTILPVTRATLAFKTTGRVGSLPVREGASVKKGDVNAKLEVRLLEAQVNQADAAFNAAKIQYDRV